MEIVGEYSAEGHSGKNIKGRQEFMDNLDVTDIHYDKKISDLHRRLDTQ